MIDTLKLILPVSEIKSNNSFTIQPIPFLAGTGEILGKSLLFIDTKGRKFFGTKAYYNDQKVNVTIFPMRFDKELNNVTYNEQLNLDFKQNFFESRQGFIIVQISVPKFYIDRKSTRLNSSHIPLSRMPSSA